MLRAQLISVLQKQGGVLFAKPAIVSRVMYRGRNVIAPSNDSQTDDRGYYAVEWWIMSLTQAGNEILRAGEGISNILLPGTPCKEVPFTKAVEVAEKELLGTYKAQWPLTKILDIGGKPMPTSFSPEVPGIPCHTHSGNVIHDGKEVILDGPGKLEAYFFPPIDIPPYNLKGVSAITRLGVKPGVTKEQLITALKQFGKDDSCYTLLNVYPIQPYDAWTLPPGILHAPGPWTTFEIQRPQDDFNLASWTLGVRIPENKIPEMRQTQMLRGIKDEAQWVDKLLNWDLCTLHNFEERFHHKISTLEEGDWGRRLQIFFGTFYGEAFEINPNKVMIRKGDSRPFAGICWAGSGLLNGNVLDVNSSEHKEFLVVPTIEVVISNTGKDTLLVFTVFPLNGR